MARKKKTKIVKLGGAYYKIRGVVLGEVKFYIGFGWLISDELFELRQTDPRISP